MKILETGRNGDYVPSDTSLMLVDQTSVEWRKDGKVELRNGRREGKEGFEEGLKGGKDGMVDWSRDGKVER